MGPQTVVYHCMITVTFLKQHFRLNNFLNKQFFELRSVGPEPSTYSCIRSRRFLLRIRCKVCTNVNKTISRRRIDSKSLEWLNSAKIVRYLRHLSLNYLSIFLVMLKKLTGNKPITFVNLALSTHSSRYSQLVLALV